MNVAIIGTGYVGLVTGAVLSEIGHTVSCLDISEHKINMLRSGKSPIYEPGLEEILQRNIENGRLHFTTKAEEAFHTSEVIFIAVGTPQGKMEQLILLILSRLPRILRCISRTM